MFLEIEYEKAILETTFSVPKFNLLVSSWTTILFASDVLILISIVIHFIVC